MSQPKFEFEDVNRGCFLIHDAGRTVALVTPQGYIDWLLKSPLDQGPKLTEVRKETHLSYCLGLKLEMNLLQPAGRMTGIKRSIEESGRVVRLTGTSVTADGKLQTVTEAVLRADADATRYHWDLATTMTNVSDQAVTLGGIEYNNVLPGKTGRCFLFEPEKEYDATVMIDQSGAVWRFPHQHMMGYGRKINQLQFGQRSTAGFFGETSGSPVVVVHKSTTELGWAICDMYYDLHCCAKLDKPMQPGDSHRFEYTVKYLSNNESMELLKRAKNVPISAEDRQAHDFPRLELGSNGFLRAVDISAEDDASGFRQNPPVKVWDREVGCTGKGSLRLTNSADAECAWAAEPPTQIPNNRVLKIKAKVKTEGVEGKGFYLRVRYHTFHWTPQPHVEWARTLESTPVKGTSEGWVEVVVPGLEVPEEHFDYLIWFEVVLDGKGRGWVTDVDMDLQPIKPPPVGLEIGSSKRNRKAVVQTAGAGAGATE